MTKVEHGEVRGTWLRPGPGYTVYFTSPSWSVEIQLHGWKRVAPLYSTTTPRSFTPFSSHRVRLPLLMVMIMVMTRICSPIQLLGTCSSATIVLPARVVSACILPLHSLALPLRSRPRCPGGWIDARSCIRTSENSSSTHSGE